MAMAGNCISCRCRVMVGIDVHRSRHLITWTAARDHAGQSIRGRVVEEAIEEDAGDPFAAEGPAPVSGRLARFSTRPHSYRALTSWNSRFGRRAPGAGNPSRSG